ncbi:hypothetical protein MASR2M15_14520 [Anaerolineales bacterium]
MRKRAIHLIYLAVFILLLGATIPILSQEATEAAEDSSEAIIPTIEPSHAVIEATLIPTEIPQKTYRVNYGDTLYRIAVIHGLKVRDLVTANNISNPNIIYPGQLLIIPAKNAVVNVVPTATPETISEALPTAIENPTVVEEVIEPTVEVNSNLSESISLAKGIEIFVNGQDADTLLAIIQDANYDWVKISVNWRDIELIQGQINFEDLDAIIEKVANNNIKILLNLSSAPDWARPSIEKEKAEHQGDPSTLINRLAEDGPPDDFADFGAFVSVVANRYQGKVQAYEIWSDPNLRKEWNSALYPIRADHYVALLKTAQQAIQAADPQAIIVSAGLAPTALNDGFNAIDDRVFLQNMISNQVQDYIQAVGIHPFGWANAPAASCCATEASIPTHNDNRVFYFKDNLEDYQQILSKNGLLLPLWATSFGWGSSEGAVLGSPNEGNIYLNYLNEEQVAEYIREAFEMGESIEYVEAMFAYNLNGCSVSMPLACYYSMIDANGAARPAIQANVDLP